MLQDDRTTHAPPPATAGAGRVVVAVFGLAFAGVGVTVLGYLWFTPRDTFGAPPLFFRIFASFIAIPFVAMGGTMAVAGLRGGRSPLVPRPPVDSARAAGPPAAGAYACPQCGAPLGTNADVSPSGDAKCAHCGRWFNIHRAG